MYQLPRTGLTVGMFAAAGMSFFLLGLILLIVGVVAVRSVVMDRPVFFDD